MSEDVKELLGKAFGQEPPLGIDRDEVLQQGRKRLRRRRFAEAGSVVALVVVVAVGAATLTNFAGSGHEDRMPPAASSTEHAPPGPDLPVTSGPPTPSTAETTTVNTSLPLSVDSQEAQLTALLYATGVLNEKEASAVPNSPDPPEFRKMDDQYIYGADVTHSSASGYVEVLIDLSPNMIVDCGDVQSPSEDCDIKIRADTQVSLTHSSTAAGERTTRASAVSPNGIWVTVSASNITRHDRELNRHPRGGKPVLSDDELCILVTKAALGV